MASTTQSPIRRGGTRGFRILRVIDIDIVADWSLLIIFAIIVIGLGASLFPSWHPAWSAALTWSLAVIAGLGLIASIALHELAHAWVAKRNGVMVRRITLFVFGGVTQLEGRPRSPAAELRIAGVGPLVSAVLGVILVWLGSVLAQPAMELSEDAAEVAARMGPTATVLLWLGTINLLLAVFNLLPGFPLDGGRVLRAGLWHITGDLRRATRWAAGSGQVIAWMLMLLGIAMIFGLWVPFLGTGLVNGLWLVLIGWFLANAAQLGHRQLILQQALEGVAVGDVVRARSELWVEPDTTIAALVDGPAMLSDAPWLPVVEGGRLLGVVDVTRLDGIPRDRWTTVTAAEGMMSVDEVVTLHPDVLAVDALETLAHQDPVPVIRDPDRTLVGLLRTRDVARWLSLHGEGDVERHMRQPA